MADVTVAQFAEVLTVPVDKLLTQLDEAGIKVSGSSSCVSSLSTVSRYISSVRSSVEWYYRHS